MGGGGGQRLHTYRYTETWCITSTETIRFVRRWGDGWWGVWGGGGAGQRLHTYRYTETGCITSTETIRFVRRWGDGWWGVWGGGGGRDYIPIATLKHGA